MKKKVIQKKQKGFFLFISALIQILFLNKFHGQFVDEQKFKITDNTSVLK